MKNTGQYSSTHMCDIWKAGNFLTHLFRKYGAQKWQQSTIDSCY